MPFRARWTLSPLSSPLYPIPNYLSSILMFPLLSSTLNKHKYIIILSGSLHRERDAYFKITSNEAFWNLELGLFPSVSVEPHLTLVWPLAQEHQWQAGPWVQAPVPQAPFDWQHAQLLPTAGVVISDVGDKKRRLIWKFWSRKWKVCVLIHW